MPNTTTFDTLDALVQHYLDELHIPGAAVGILHDGQRETHGFGVVSVSSGYLTQPETLFQIGSQSKIFTATLVMMLVDEGKLDLDTPIRAYLPDLKLADEQALARITTRQLLTHMSGLEGDRFEDLGVGDDALSKHIGLAYTWAQETDPGELWSYCNSGFSLAGTVVEALTGQSYEQVVRERIFEPLAMTRAFLFARDAIVHSAAAGHTYAAGQDEPQVALPYEIPRCSNPAGGVIADVGDMLTWFQFHLNSGQAGDAQLLKPETVQVMQQAQVRITETQGDGMEWGIGWSLGIVDGVRTYGHGGGTNGHISHGLVVPEHGFAISVLTNSSRGAKLCAKVEEWALARYCGLNARKPEHIELPREQLERLTGTYTRPLGSVTIALEDGRLTATSAFTDWVSGELETDPPIALAPISTWEVIATSGEFEGSRAQFIPNAEGSAPRFLRFGGRLMTKAE